MSEDKNTNNKRDVNKRHLSEGDDVSQLQSMSESRASILSAQLDEIFSEVITVDAKEEYENSSRNIVTTESDDTERMETDETDKAIATAVQGMSIDSPAVTQTEAEKGKEENEKLG